MATDKSEKQLVEEYIRAFALEECLDEVLNDVVDARPTNPYVAIARAMEAKTMAEVIDVFVYSVIAANGGSAVQVKVVTNIGVFFGACGYAKANADDDNLIDCLALQDLLRDIIRHVDPRDLRAVDALLAASESLNRFPHVVLATSIACCRAGARHKGQDLFRFIADFVNGPLDMTIPLPVITVFTRANPMSNSEAKMPVQDIMFMATTAMTLESCLESIMKLSNFVKSKVYDGAYPVTVSEGACPNFKFATVEEAVTFGRDVVLESSVSGGMKMALDLKAGLFYRKSDPENIGYDLGPEGTVTDAKALMETLSRLWRDAELISVEDPVHDEGLAALPILGEKIDDAVAAIERESSEELSYQLKGVGGEDGCRLQVVADGLVGSGEWDLEKLDALRASSVNTLKLRLSGFRTVSRALDACKAAKDGGWALQVGSEEEAPETADSFLADFAVGVGALQLAAGGLGTEGAVKYNRLLEIAQDESIRFVAAGFRKIEKIKISN